MNPALKFPLFSAPNHINNRADINKPARPVPRHQVEGGIFLFSSKHFEKSEYVTIALSRGEPFRFAFVSQFPLQPLDTSRSKVIAARMTTRPKIQCTKIFFILFNLIFWVS